MRTVPVTVVLCCARAVRYNIAGSLSESSITDEAQAGWRARDVAPATTGTQVTGAQRYDNPSSCQGCIHRDHSEYACM